MSGRGDALPMMIDKIPTLAWSRRPDGTTVRVNVTIIQLISLNLFFVAHGPNTISPPCSKSWASARVPKLSHSASAKASCRSDLFRQPALSAAGHPLVLIPCPASNRQCSFSVVINRT